MRGGRWGPRLKRHGYKCTRTREIIMDVLDKTEDHLSPEDIFFKAHEEYPNIGLTTVYRTLEMLVKLGMVQKYDFGDGKSRYELSEGLSKKPHHHHIICYSCGRITDYYDFVEEELKLLGKIEKKLGSKYNYRITGHMLQFNGLCEKCR